MTRFTEEARLTPGNVLCESYVMFRAGKPFFIDAFNVQERMKAGKLSEDTITRLIQEGKLTQVKRI